MALYDVTTAYNVPCISGKDSMKNDYHIGNTKISVPPTLLFSVIARMPDVRQAVTMDVKHPGDLVFMLGETHAELGASEYYAQHGFVGNRVPQVNAQRARHLYDALSQAMARGLVSACHDLLLPRWPLPVIAGCPSTCAPCPESQILTVTTSCCTPKPPAALW
jgi:phosphoribosylformylglycinamidine synthase